MAGYAALLFLLLSLPLRAFADLSIYTIQTGSFRHADDAQKQFDSIIDQCDEEELIHLRIERIGAYYTVRMGKFKTTDEAEKFLRSVQNRLDTFLLMKAYYREERIERLYETGVNTMPQTSDEAALTTQSVDTELSSSEKSVNEMVWKIKAMPVEKQIKAISDLIDKEQYKEALEVTKAVIVLRPEVPEINGLHGTVLFKLERPAEAIRYLRKAVDLFPGVSEYHNRIGYCLILLSKFEEAVNEFKKAISFNPSHIGALAGLGISYAELGNKEKAMAIYEQLRRLDSDITEIFLQIIEGT